MRDGGPPGTALHRLLMESPTFPACDAPALDREDLSSDLDDRTADYMLAVGDAFDGLSDATRQLAALLILCASGVALAPDHPVLGQARQRAGEAGAAVRHARPTARAAHHHRHLLHAASCLEAALSGSGGLGASAKPDVRRALGALRRAAAHLRGASCCLPGLEVVALGQGCGCRRPAGFAAAST